MRHNFAFKKYGRSSAHRRAMFSSLGTEFLRRERCETTLAKAKGLRSWVERLICLAAKGDTLPARRRAYAALQDKGVVHKLFAEIGPRYKTRAGGYTRIVRSAYRHGDAAKMAWIELVVAGQDSAKQTTKKRTPAKKTSAKA